MPLPVKSSQARSDMYLAHAPIWAIEEAEQEMTAKARQALSELQF